MNTAATQTFDLEDILRALAGAMHYPVIVLLILLLLAAVLLLGWLLAEYITERRQINAALPELLEAMRHTDDLANCVEGSGLLRRQKDALIELTRHPDFSPELREALAIRLMDAEQERYDGILRLSELVARLAPMFGLLGTLIPLGPGILALGQGDTFTLSASLLTAFDTTIAGLLAAAVATVVSSFRRSWYRQYVSQLEVLSQCILDREKEEKPC